MWGTEGDCIIEKRTFVKWIAESCWLADCRLRVLPAARPYCGRPGRRPGRRAPHGHGSARRGAQALAIPGHFGRAAPPVPACPERREGACRTASWPEADRWGGRIPADAPRTGGK